MNVFLYFLKVAWQGLGKRPGFTFSVISTMSVTLGALFCVGGLFYFLVLKPLPYQDQDLLYKVEKVQIDKLGLPNVKAYGYASLVHLYKNQSVFSSVGIAHYDDEVLVSHPSQPKVPTAYVTPDFFETLGVSTYLGRLFDDSEKLDSFIPSAIISYNAWKTLFNSDPAVIGTDVSVRGRSFNLIGVMSPDFIEPELEGIGRQTVLWMPWDFNPTPEGRRTRWGDRDNPRVFIGKLNSDTTHEQATQALTALVDRTWREKVADIPFYKGWRIEIELNSFRDVILGESQLVAYLLLACAISLVFIAIANVSNLFLSRAFQRKKEFAISAAVGALPRQLRLSMFAETFLLMAIAMVIGLALALLGTDLMRTYLADVLPVNSLNNINVLGLLIAIVTMFGLAWLFAIVSTKVIDYGKLQSSLLGSGKGTGAQISKNVRHGLILVQVMVMTVLVFVNLAFLFSSYKAIQDQEVLDTQYLISLELSFNTTESISRDQRTAMLEQVMIELDALPQVKSVSQSLSPIVSSFNTWSLTDEDSLRTVLPEAKIVDENYFNLTQQELLQGNLFTNAHAKDRERVLIINDVLARNLYPDGTAVGQRLSFDVSRKQSSFLIVGVVRGIKQPGGLEIPPRVYRPLKGGSSFLIQMQPGQRLARYNVQSLLQNVSKLLVVYDIETLDNQKQSRLKNQYLTAISSMLLTVISVALATVGLYGIISYGTQLRRSEIGIRLSIGARRKDILKQLMLDHLQPLMIGIGASLVVLFFVSDYFDAHVVNVINNYWFLILVTTLLCILSISICSIIKPLMNYFKVQPIVLLRDREKQ